MLLLCTHVGHGKGNWCAHLLLDDWYELSLFMSLGANASSGIYAGIMIAELV